MVSQMAPLSLLLDALAMLRDDDALRRTGQRLQDLAQVLQPGRERREPPSRPQNPLRRRQPQRWRESGNEHYPSRQARRGGAPRAHQNRASGLTGELVAPLKRHGAILTKNCHRFS